MTWDATLYAVRALPENYPDDFHPRPMGPVDDVKARLAEVLPGLLWSGSAARYSDSGCQAELVLWGEFAPVTTGEVDHVTVGALGNGHLAELLRKLCAAHGWVALDDATGTLLEVTPVARDRVTAGFVDGKTSAARRRHIRLMVQKGDPTFGPPDEIVRVLSTALDVTEAANGLAFVSGERHRVEVRLPHAGAPDTIELYAVGAGVDDVIRTMCALLRCRAFDEEQGWLE